MDTLNRKSEKEFHSVIIGKLMSISGILQKESNRLLLPYQLNQQQFSVLFEIARAGEVRQKNMVNRLLLEKAHVSKIVRKLQSMGLIKITPLEGDKRSAILSPTEKGFDIIRRCRTVFDEWKKEKLSQFSSEELLQILESVDRLQKAFINNYSKDR